MTLGLGMVGHVLDWRPNGRTARRHGARPQRLWSGAFAVPPFGLGQALRTLRQRFVAPAVAPEAPDLIDHPAFRAMSLLELADLPFPRPAARDEAGASGAPSAEVASSPR